MPDLFEHGQQRKREKEWKYHIHTTMSYSRQFVNEASACRAATNSSLCFFWFVFFLLLHQNSLLYFLFWCVLNLIYTPIKWSSPCNDRLLYTAVCNTERCDGSQFCKKKLPWCRAQHKVYLVQLSASTLSLLTNLKNSATVCSQSSGLCESKIIIFFDNLSVLSLIGTQDCLLELPPPELAALGLHAEMSPLDAASQFETFLIRTQRVVAEITRLPLLSSCCCFVMEARTQGMVHCHHPAPAAFSVNEHYVGPMTLTFCCFEPTEYFINTFCQFPLCKVYYLL